MNHLAYREIRAVRIVVFILFILLIPLIIYAQSGMYNLSPPVSQQLVREGTFAIKLQTSLGLGTDEDEVTAEGSLGDVGIMPKNGWNSDYPMTPDIIVEVQKSVDDAAKGGKLPFSYEEALTRFHEITAEFNLSIKPYVANQGNIQTSSSANSPDSALINNYYYNDGPPVVTYYTPPDDYFYMYEWVPYPFWWSDFWFPGYFILHDFNRIVDVDHRDKFISNHFHGFKGHRVFDVDETTEDHGKHHIDRDMPQRSNAVPHVVPKGEMQHFSNGVHTGMTHNGRIMGFEGLPEGGSHR